MKLEDRIVEDVNAAVTCLVNAQEKFDGAFFDEADAVTRKRIMSFINESLTEFLYYNSDGELIGFGEQKND